MPSACAPQAGAAVPFTAALAISVRIIREFHRYYANATVCPHHCTGSEPLGPDFQTMSSANDKLAAELLDILERIPELLDRERELRSELLSRHDMRGWYSAGALRNCKR